MIIKANIKANPTINVNLENGYSFVSVKSVNGKTGNVILDASDVGADEEGTAKAIFDKLATETGGDTLIWDGNTEGRECYDDNYYKVTDVFLPYSSDSQVVITLSQGDVISSPSVFFSRRPGYCTIGNDEIYVYTTEEGALGLSQGVYLRSDVRSLQVVGFTNFEKEVLIKEECLPKSNVEAGTYGGFDSSVPAYNIPNVTVDEYGRITEASNSVLPKASAESDGYIGTDDYKKIGYVPSIKCTGRLVISAGTIKSISYYTYHEIVDEGATNFDIPPVFYMVGEYTDDEGNSRQIPVKWDAIKTSGTDKSGNPAVTYFIYAIIENPIDYTIYVTAYSNYPFYYYK